MFISWFYWVGISLSCLINLSLASKSFVESKNCSIQSPLSNNLQMLFKHKGFDADFKFGPIISVLSYVSVASQIIIM
jgi:hypothetical protein